MTGLLDIPITRHKPPEGTKDWNDAWTQALTRWPQFQFHQNTNHDYEPGED